LLVVRSFSDGLEVIAGGTTLPLVSQHLSTASSLLTATTSVANRQESSSGDVFMIAESSGTETVVRNHLHAFLGKQGIDSIVQDYHESALFYSEAKIYRGKQEIHGFFADFIDSLPAGGIDRFQLRSLHVEGNIAYITWSVGKEIPLGTDTFVVDRGKIVSQTFAMHTATVRRQGGRQRVGVRQLPTTPSTRA
jgi:hypothetical protein